MKPLDLTKQIQTVDGRKYELLKSNYKGLDGDTLIGVITEKDGIEQLCLHQANGKYFSGEEESSSDLMNVPEVMYANFNEGTYNPEIICFAGYYPSRNYADSVADSTRCACIRFTVGQFDD